MAIIEPVSGKLTDEILYTINVNDIIYAEYANPGAMGNSGGLIMYIMKDNILFCYETSCLTSEKDGITYDNAFDILNNNSKYFRNKNNQNKILNKYEGWFGNYVFININYELRPFEDYFILYYNGNNFRISSSVQGIFNNVVYAMQT